MKVLIVDDEVTIRKGIIKLLGQGLDGVTRIDEAGNGEEALRIARKTKPDLVITDIQMPVMDGLELIERIRSNDWGTEIVVLTGFAEFEYVQKALKYQVVDYLLKPITQQSLQETVTNIMLRDPSKWMSAMRFEDIRFMRESISGLVRGVLSGKQREWLEQLAIWFDFCRKQDFSLHELKQIMGHFELLFRSELHAIVKEYPLDRRSGFDAPPASLSQWHESWKTYLQDQADSLSERRSPRNRKIAQDVIRFIEEHYGDPDMNLQLLAEHCRVSPANLSKIFRETMNAPITQYISDFRLERARQRIQAEEGETIADIAQQCGFNDYPYFSKIFKKRFGMAPLEYKELNQ